MNKLTKPSLQRIYNSLTPAQQAQKIHWSTLGNLHRIKGIVIYLMDTNNGLTQFQRDSLIAIHKYVIALIKEENKNNEFINLNIKPAWKSGKIKR